jgi:hypothetical protein
VFDNLSSDQLLTQMRKHAAAAADGVALRTSERSLRWMFVELDKRLCTGKPMPAEWRPTDAPEEG